MSRVRIAVLCLARNCRRQIPMLDDFDASLSANDLDATFFFGENGSRDGTRDALSSVAYRKPNWFVQPTDEMSSHVERLERMAIGREILLKTLLGSPVSFDYVMVMDVDNVFAAAPSARAIKRAICQLEEDRQLFGIAASSDPYYYDLLALRIPGTFMTNLAIPIRAAKRRFWTYHRFMKDHVFAVQRRVTGLRNPRCLSAFNGLCIYRFSDYIRSTYLCPEAATLSEHVTFNTRIHELRGGWIEISSQIRLSTPAEHGPRSALAIASSVLTKLFRRIADNAGLRRKLGVP